MFFYMLEYNAFSGTPKRNVSSSQKLQHSTLCPYFIICGHRHTQDFSLPVDLVAWENLTHSSWRYYHASLTRDAFLYNGQNFLANIEVEVSTILDAICARSTRPKSILIVCRVYTFPKAIHVLNAKRNRYAHIYIEYGISKVNSIHTWHMRQKWTSHKVAEVNFNRPTRGGGGGFFCSYISTVSIA